ncbi:MAG: carbon monoxide dehydrogenase, partial [Alphaproteobacteria bacterium HGW-Alphaproteobacteria-2]
MKPVPFDYARPESLEEAVALVADVGAEARVIAGGQSLVAMLNMRLARPALLVDVMHLPGMAAPRIERDRLLIPCAVRQAALAGRGTLAGEVPLLAAALPWVGHPQTRARGTLCGSVAHADPSAELPLVLVALGGVVHLRGRSRREVAAAGFFLGTMLTERADDELIEAVSLPLTPPGTGTAFAEIGRRRGDFAIVACAAVAQERHLR